MGYGGASETITVSPIVATTYTVTVTDAHGCTGTDEVTVNISAPVAAHASAGNPAFCLPVEAPNCRWRPPVAPALLPINGAASRQGLLLI